VGEHQNPLVVGPFRVDFTHRAGTGHGQNTDETRINPLEIRTMKRWFTRTLPLLMMIVPATVVLTRDARPAHAENAHHAARRLARWYTWHGRYYHTEWGTPVALVVPPTASMQTEWGWGVGNTRVSRINHQFARPYPGPGGWDEVFLPTPPWPSDTNQFGVYYVRGPW
jgi:hypothetical protein